MYLLSYLKQGFGNKLFMIMKAINTYRKGDYDALLLVYTKSHHEKGTPEENVLDIFPKLNELPWLKFISWKEYDSLKKDNEELLQDYEFVPDDFIELRPFIKKYFVMNSKYDYLLDKYDTKKGIGVHIRLGDKFEINKKFLKETKRENYLLLQPRYYIEQVENLLKEKKGPVYIFTDSPRFAKCFGLNAEIVDEGFIETFYLFTKFRRSVISESTLTQAASYMNFFKHKSVVPEYFLENGRITKSPYVHPDYFTLVTDRSYKLKPSEYSELSKCV